VRTSSRRRWLQKLLLGNESEGWRVSPAPRTAQADPVARCTAGVGRGLGACEPPISLVTGLQPAVPSRPCWGAYLFSSKVSVACGQLLDWRGVRHTRELCGDADPRGHLRESYVPSISMKSTSDLDRHHMPWGFLEHNKSMSPLGAANNHVRLRQSSTRMTAPFSTPPFWGRSISSSTRAASSSTGAGLAAPENASPPTRSVVTVSAPLPCLFEARI
jgi:hypothetical protein